MIVKMYRVEGMHCNGCVATVKRALKAVPGVIEAQVQLKGPEAIISMTRPVPPEELQKVLSTAGGYSIVELADESSSKKGAATNKKKGLRKTLGFFSPKKECCK